MARRVRDFELESRTARAKLKARGKPYYRSIGPGLHLGYRKGDEARRWVARLYIGAGKYAVEVIGDADDVADADGKRVLDFWQAQERAHDLLKQHGGEPLGPYTVKEAISDYVEHLKGRATCRDTEVRLAAYVPAALGDKPVVKLTRQDLVAWHRGLANTLPRVRTKTGAKKQAHLAVDLNDPEVLRKRKASANRVLAKLKAALNFALTEEKVVSDRAWARVAPFEKVAAARLRYLSLAECKRLINASEPDFRPLVQAALQTGCRYQELARLRVADFNPDVGTLLIRMSKTGKARHVVLTEEGGQFFAQLATGRSGDAPILGREWPTSNQARPMRQACERAKIEPRISFHGLRHTWASLSVMAGMPLMVVARNLGHADTGMVEKYYGHLSPSYVADEIRAHAPRFGIVEPGNVRALR